MLLHHKLSYIIRYITGIVVLSKTDYVKLKYILFYTFYIHAVPLNNLCLVLGIIII